MAYQYRKIIRQLITAPLVFYKKFISPIIPKACLYEPSCSVYMKDSIVRFGVFRGLILGLARLFRCNGWFFTGGDDPVPEKFSWKSIAVDYRKFSSMKKS